MTSRLRRLVALLLAAVATLAASGRAAAQRRALAWPDVVSIDDALDLYVARSPRVRAEDAYAEVGRGDVLGAGTIENPTLAYQGMGLAAGEPTNGGSQHTFQLAQTIPWPGQIDRRVDAAAGALAAARARASARRAAGAIEVMESFLDLLAAEERLSRTEAALRDLDRVARVVQGRADAGAGSRLDAARIEVEVASLDAALGDARGDLDAAGAVLATILGAPGWSPRASGDLAASLLDRPVPDPEAHPARAAAEREVDAARASVRAEELWAIPRPTLSVGAVASSAPEGGYLFGGISIPLPLFDQNQGAIERARRSLAGAELARDAVESSMDAARRGALRTLHERRRTLERFGAAALERLPALLAMAETSFTGGQSSIHDLLDAVRAARDLRARHVELLVALRRAEIALLATSGDPSAR